MTIPVAAAGLALGAPGPQLLIGGGPLSTPQAWNCSLDSARELASRPAVGLPSHRLELRDDATQGSEATVYGNPAEPSVIAVTFFGETGRVDISFYLDKNRAYVRHKTSNYAGRLRPDVPVASTATYEFVICDGRRPVYPNSRDITVCDQAVHILSLVRSRLSAR
jgi:hypothetical protein